MKKLTGWLLIVFCTILLLIFAITLIAIFPGLISKDVSAKMSIKEIISSFVGFFIVISLLIIGLRNGIKRVKKEKITEIVNYNKDLNINLKGQIHYKDYRNLMLSLSFKRPIYLVVLGILVLFLMSLLVNGKDVINQLNSNYSVFFVIGIFILSPIYTLVQINKIYKSNRIFQEQLNYTLSNDSIHIKGSTVDSIQNWKHFYKMKDTKNFFMFYPGNMVATLIDKKMFSTGELNEFQNFVKSLNIKKV